MSGLDDVIAYMNETMKRYAIEAVVERERLLRLEGSVDGEYFQHINWTRSDQDEPPSCVPNIIVDDFSRGVEVSETEHRYPLDAIEEEIIRQDIHQEQIEAMQEALRQHLNATMDRIVTEALTSDGTATTRAADNHEPPLTFDRLQQAVNQFRQDVNLSHGPPNPTYFGHYQADVSLTREPAYEFDVTRYTMSIIYAAGPAFPSEVFTVIPQFGSNRQEDYVTRELLRITERYSLLHGKFCQEFLDRFGLIGCTATVNIPCTLSLEGEIRDVRVRRRNVRDLPQYGRLYQFKGMDLGGRDGAIARLRAEGKTLGDINQALADAGFSEMTDGFLPTESHKICWKSPRKWTEQQVQAAKDSLKASGLVGEWVQS